MEGQSHEQGLAGSGDGVAMFGLGLFMRFGAAGSDLYGVIGVAAFLTAVCAAVAIVVGERHGAGIAALTGGVAALLCGNGFAGPIPGASAAFPCLILAMGLAAGLSAGATSIHENMTARRAAAAKPGPRHFTLCVAVIIIVAFTGSAAALDPQNWRPATPLYPRGGFGEFAELAEYYTSELQPQGDASVSSFTFGLDMGAQTISQYDLEFAVMVNTSRLYLYSATDNHGQSQMTNTSQQDPRIRIALDAAVPLQQLAAELDRFGLDALRESSGEELSVKLMLSREDGRLVISDSHCDAYLLNRGRATMFKPGEAAVVSGRVVMLRVSPATVRADSSAGDRLYILTALCDNVKTVGVPPGLLTGESVAARIYDVNGDGSDETIYLTDSKPDSNRDRRTAGHLRNIAGRGALIPQTGLRLGR